jgi:DNA-binding SARP family transcriptional activator/TolB-like protein/tetratricopeptide (TPR) repeat protein
MTLRAGMRLRLLGRFGVIPVDGESTPIQLPTKKSGALLAYLGMSRDYTASREELAALLWGDCSDQHARQSLRQALALLRKELGPSHLCTADTQIVRLDPALWSIDARDFEALARSQKAEDLSGAARLFAGDFLSGVNIDEEAFEEWLSAQRTRLQLVAGQLCETFVKRPDLVLDANQALAAVEQLMALDPLREDWQRIAIVLYARYRGKNEALARAGIFAGLLQRELGVAPERETRAMLESIKGNDGPPPPAALSDGANNIACAPAADLVAVAPEAWPEPSVVRAVSAFTALRSRFSGRGPTAKILAVVGIATLVLAAGIFDLGSFRAISRPSASPGSALSTRSDPWRSPSSTREAELPKGIIPIVVLPFVNSGGADDGLLLIAEMLTDDLTNTLSRVPSFRVISRKTARSFHGQAIDVAKLGTELQVRYVLEGSVRLHDDNLRVNVELIDPATRLSVWSGRVERSGADRQGVRDEIVSRLARELQFEVLPIESSRLSKDFGADALAYRGWAALSEINLGGYREALALFNQALERDPQNLSARTGVGAYHARMGAQVFDTDARGHRAKAEEILRQVLNRDPNSSPAHFYLALALNVLPTLPEALEHLERAIKIDPSDASAHAQIGNGLIRSGRPAAGLEYVRYAMRLSPRDPIMPVWLEFAGNGELELNNYPEAIATFQRSIALNAGYPRSWAGLAAAYALAGSPDEAHRVADKLKTFAPNLGNEALARQFGRHDGSRLREGLVLAFALPPS